MPVLERDEFFNRLQDRLGDDTSEEALSFMEDMSDTYNALEQRANGDGVDWKARYEELDNSWRTKYKRRFFSGPSTIPATGGADDDPEDKPDNSANITVEDLFK